MFLAEPTCPCSGAALFPMFQQLQFPEQGWLPWKHHLHTSPSSPQPPSFSWQSSPKQASEPWHLTSTGFSLTKQLGRAAGQDTAPGGGIRAWPSSPPPCCSLQTQLNAQVQLQHSHGPQSLRISSPWWVQPGQNSPWLLEKSTSKSQELLHRGCHNPLGLQLPAGESWALPPDQLSPDTKIVREPFAKP